MRNIDPIKVAERYNALENLIDNDDIWHLKTRDKIKQFVTQEIVKIGNVEQLEILNAGSAGYSYTIKEDNMLHVDVADKHIAHLSNSIVANIENLPLADNQFDLIICVGSVLNYCDPVLVMKEFSRVLKKDGHLILEFECSYTFELLFKRGFNKSASFVNTIFDAHGDTESIWYFSEKYIKDLLISYGFEIKTLKRFHIISPLLLRMTNNSNFSASFIKCDRFLSKLPLINKFCSNVIISCIYTNYH